MACPIPKTMNGRHIEPLCILVAVGSSGASRCRPRNEPVQSKYAVCPKPLTHGCRGNGIPNLKTCRARWCTLRLRNHHLMQGAHCHLKRQPRRKHAAREPIEAVGHVIRDALENLWVDFLDKHLHQVTVPPRPNPGTSRRGRGRDSD
jgi:hypothetical protein